MIRIASLLVALTFIFDLTAQTAENANRYNNSAEKILNAEGKLQIGGYGEIHYNQPFDSDIRSNGTLDVHRMVLMVGYHFSPNTQFVSEIEFEHVSEVYVEQAFLQHKLSNQLNVRAGLLLIPMGIVNEYHEPTTFNGVERPLIDNKIAPSTWREIGIGLSGSNLDAALKYQLYLVNGFNGFNGKGNLSGKNGFRNGRQKGAESFISSPNLAGKLEYFGIRNLNVGLSGYFGKTQSTLYNGIGKQDATALVKADSSVVGISMVGVDARYNLGGWHFKGQYYYANIGNTEQYNRFTAINGRSNDVGSAMMGYYVEAGYDVLRSFKKTQVALIPFIRYENYDTHAATTGLLARNKAYSAKGITTGLTCKLAKGAVVKADLQMVKSESTNEYTSTMNLGVGVMF